MSDPALTDLQAPAAATEVHAPVVVAVASDACAACGTMLAPDQRYCVECGHSRGRSRMPAFAAAFPQDGAVAAGGPDLAAPYGASDPPGRSWRRSAAWYSPNATLVALVGALLLAVGVGVLIGRSNSGQNSGTARVSTVYLSGPGASVGAGAPVVPAAAPAAAAKTTTAAAAAAAKKAAAVKAAPPAKTTPPKAVHVGSAGSGPGYQKGKFTGNFFGGG